MQTPDVRKNIPGFQKSYASESGDVPDWFQWFWKKISWGITSFKLMMQALFFWAWYFYKTRFWFSLMDFFGHAANHSRAAWAWIWSWFDYDSTIGRLWKLSRKMVFMWIYIQTTYYRVSLRWFREPSTPFAISWPQEYLRQYRTLNWASRCAVDMRIYGTASTGLLLISQWVSCDGFFW